MLAILKDITELKQAQEKLLHDAFHDPLTNLPNRALFLDRLEKERWRERSGTRITGFAVLFIDIDRFKIVNDSLGHHAGDELIIQFSKRILHSLRLEDIISRPTTPHSLVNEWTTKDDTLARLGGDEFTVLLDDLRSPTDSIRVASRIQQSLVEPFVIAGQEVFTTASIGIAASSQSYASAAGCASSMRTSPCIARKRRARPGVKSSIRRHAIWPSGARQAGNGSAAGA